MKRIFCLILAVLLVVPALMQVPTAIAASASIIYAPSSVTVTNGGQVSVTVLVSSDTAMSGLDFYASFPANIVSATNVDVSGSDFNLVISKSIDNSAGTVHFIMSTIVAGGVTNAKVGVITFQGNSVGSGTLSIKSGGQAAESGPQAPKFPLSSSGGTITVQAQAVATPPPSSSKPTQTQTFKPTATSAPTITSSTHPNQDSWYNSRQVAISWTGGSQSYNYAFDQSATTQLADKSTGSQASASTILTSDGVWYAHVKALTAKGWSATSHFKLQADTVAPVEFTPTSEPVDQGPVSPTLRFSSSDATSGIDHYEISVDDGSWSTITSPYKVGGLSVSAHTFALKAVDKAGNASSSQIKYTMQTPQAPVITFPSNKQLFILGQTVAVKGRAGSNLAVEIYVNGKKTATTKADDNGNFATPKGLSLFAGAYTVVAKAVSPDGMISPPSTSITMTIDARAVKLFGLVWPGWLLLLFVLLIMALLLAVIVWLVGRLIYVSRKWLVSVGIMKQAVHDDIKVLEEQLDQQVDGLLATDATQAAAVKAEMAKALDTAEEHLNQTADAMVIREPVLPILHGSFRFGGHHDETATAGPAIVVPANSGPGLPDAGLIFNGLIVPPTPVANQAVTPPLASIQEPQQPTSQSEPAQPSQPAQSTIIPVANTQESKDPTTPLPQVPQESQIPQPMPSSQPTTIAAPPAVPPPAVAVPPVVEAVPQPIDLLAPTITQTAAKET